MAKIQFLTILLVVTCFLGGVVSVTDKEFEVRTVHYVSLKFQSSIRIRIDKHLILQNLVAFAHRQAEELEIQSGLIEHLRGENRVSIYTHISRILLIKY